MTQSPSVRSRLVGFAIVLVGAFATAYAVGERASGHSHQDTTSGQAGHSGHAHGNAPTAPATELAGYQLVRLAGRGDQYVFVIRTPTGTSLTNFPEAHGARLHVVAVRDDLSEFHHVHPTVGTDGSIALDEFGDGLYHVVFDFVAGDTNTPIILAANYDNGTVVASQPLPTSNDTPTIDHATGQVVVHRTSNSTGMSFVISGRGDVARRVEPYLGQAAHLVAIRQGDLTYLHLHPSPSQDPTRLTFDSLLSPGTWRLWLQFGYDGDVVTVPYTVIV